MQYLNNDIKTKFWITFMKIGAITGCHQRYDRSLIINNYQFPLCARCTGLLFGQLIGLIIFRIFLSIEIYYLLVIFLFFLLILGIDGFGQLKNKWISNNKRRFITGFLCSLFSLLTVINILHMFTKK